MIYFHGNAGNVGARIPHIDILVKKLNTNVLILAYRGYGHSEGTPSEDGLRLDAEATLDYALNDDEIDSSRVFVYGQSLGGAVAAQLTSNNSKKVKGLILENTFVSIGEMVDHLMPFVAKFKFLI